MGTVTCIRCGYDLSAHAESHRVGVLCPECGEPHAAQLPSPTAKTSILYSLVGLSCLVASFVPAAGSWGPPEVFIANTAVFAGLSVGFFMASRRRAPDVSIAAFPVLGLLAAGFWILSIILIAFGVI